MNAGGVLMNRKPVTASASAEDAGHQPALAECLGQLSAVPRAEPLQTAVEPAEEDERDSVSPLSRIADSTGASVSAGKSEIVIDAAIVNANCL